MLLNLLEKRGRNMDFYGAFKEEERHLGRVTKQVEFQDMNYGQNYEVCNNVVVLVMALLLVLGLVILMM